MFIDSAYFIGIIPCFWKGMIKKDVLWDWLDTFNVSSSIDIVCTWILFGSRKCLRKHCNLPFVLIRMNKNRMDNLPAWGWVLILNVINCGWILVVGTRQWVSRSLGSWGRKGHKSNYVQHFSFGENLLGKMEWYAT